MVIVRHTVTKYFEENRQYNDRIYNENKVFKNALFFDVNRLLMHSVFIEMYKILCLNR